MSTREPYRWLGTLGVGFAAALAMLGPGTASARKIHGATLPDPCDPVAGQDGLFVIRKPWDKALAELRRTYANVPGVVVRRLDAPSRVTAYYIENTRTGRSWDGINVYTTLGDDTVYATVLPAAPDR